MLLLVPFKSDTAIIHQPVGNYLIIAATTFCYLLFGVVNNNAPEWMILYGWSLPGMIGHLFLHADWIHLIGNMLFLFVFGNAVCSRIGNGKYLVFYLLSGLLAGIGHVLFSDLPAIGASGAVSAVVGMYLCLFPHNKISLLYVIFYRGGVFQIRSFWLISVWFLFDLIGSLMGSSAIAYHAHVAGYLVGFLAAFILIKNEMVSWYDEERPLFVPASWKKPKEVTDLKISEGKSVQAPVNASGQSSESSKSHPPLHDHKPNAFKLPQENAEQISYKETPEGFQIDCTCGKSFNIPQRRRNSLIACPGCFKEYRMSELTRENPPE